MSSKRNHISTEPNTDSKKLVYNDILVLLDEFRNEGIKNYTGKNIKYVNRYDENEKFDIDDVFCYQKKGEEEEIECRIKNSVLKAIFYKKYAYKLSKNDIIDFKKHYKNHYLFYLYLRTMIISPKTDFLSKDIKDFIVSLQEKNLFSRINAFVKEMRSKGKKNFFGNSLQFYFDIYNKFLDKNAKKASVCIVRKSSRQTKKKQSKPQKESRHIEDHFRDKHGEYYPEISRQLALHF